MAPRQTEELVAASGVASTFATLSVRALRAALEKLNDAGGELMTVSQAMALLDVAVRPGITIQELADRQGQSQSTATRNADLLGSFGRGGKAGVKLLERRERADDRRVRELWLTPKGERLVADVAGAINKGARR